MSDSHRPDDVAVHNERSLKQLAWAIEASVGQFKLFLARCNYTSLRSQLVERLQELTSVEIRILELKTSEKTLYARIQAELDSEQPDALMVFGLESVGDLDELLTATNQVREEFRKNFHFPLVLWVNDEVMEKLLRLAPDFESWAITTKFVVATDELIDFVRQTAQKLFEGNLTLTLEACREIKQGCQALQSREQGLDLELKASIESLLGFVEFVNQANRNLDTALEHYQKGLELWQQSNNLERQGQLLSDIAFCYYLKAVRHREIDHPDWQATRHYLRQSLEVFEQAQRPDLVANSILSFGRVLRQLQDWEQLQTLAHKALQQHKTENKPRELARDYGFLAEVALAKKCWSEAKELAQKALDVLSAVPSLQSANSSGVVYELPNKSVISYDSSRYRFILGQAQQYLDQHQEAIRNLEAAKRVGSPEHDTQLYLDILCHLQKLYFEQKEYLKAFEIKLERQSIEQQYGFRAFVGAGRIQPQRQATFALTQDKSQETIAPEITASGRQLDVERLVRRIGEPSYKLIVIHGQSGVGKSSLVNGGLVPALKQKAIATSDVLPVPMRVYTSWVGELGKLLAEALLEKGIDLPTPLDSKAAILEQLQQSESRNLRTVLIFDQFEEFFFVYPTPGERQQFFDFLGACLNILPVKVILSLREDYLHYLLECDRLSSMKMIGNDILTRNVRYPLGNFSAEDAKAIVERLTERTYFYLEPALIEQLVRDLAGNEGEVRPIELQIVGAQLQAENITKLAEYQARGQKEELVKRYLAEIIEDCGAENEQAAELVLYLLTDEKGIRPLKTRAELEQDLKALAADLTTEVSKLDLVLKIFVDSGMVLLLPELPTDRYQLVHDYIATFIRQQQEPKLNELIAQLEKERKQRKLGEEKLNRILKRALAGSLAAGLVLAILAIAAVRFAWQVETQKKQAEINEIEAISNSSEALFKLEQVFDALIESLKAGEKLQSAGCLEADIKTNCADIKTRVMATMRQAMYAVRQRNRLEKHRSFVYSVSFSPDGNTIASASDDYTIKLWSLEGKELATLAGHSDGVNSVSFSPDGNTIASASEDGTIKLWSRKGKLLTTFNGHSKAVRSVSFSPDGNTLASASEDGTIKLWSREGKQLTTFTGHSGTVYSVSFSPDGKTIASASADKTIKLWSLEGKELATLKGHSDTVYSVSFNSDSKTIASASADKTIKLWSREGKELATLTGHSGIVYSVSFSPDGKTIASASEDNTIKLWSREGEELITLTRHSATVNSVSFSPDGHTIASASNDRTIGIWSREDKELKTITGHSDAVNSVSFSPDGNTLASASADNTIKLWSQEDKELKTLTGHSDAVNSVSFSPDGNTLASASADNTIKLWSLEGKELKTLTGHSDAVNSVSFSPDGNTLASASADNTIKLWSLEGKELKTLTGHSDAVNSISFSPDGNTLASASADNTIKLWSREGQKLKTLTRHNRIVNSVSFSPDGNTIASVSEDGTIKLWSREGREIKTLTGHTSFVRSVSFSPDGNTIASVGEDNTIKLWSRGGEELATLTGHDDNVNSVSFSSDGNTLASASDDNKVILWNFDFKDLVKRSCYWLNDYLATNPEVLEELKECKVQ
ncbi:MAG: ribosome assembly protein 4 [Cyanobacteriota bacterium]